MADIRVGLLEKDEELRLEELITSAKMADERAGALVLYIGFVKGLVDDKKVEKLRYEVHREYTLSSLKRIAEEIVGSDERVTSLYIFHRMGSFRPGEDVVYIIAAAATRDAAFDAARKAIDRVKHETGIWKLEEREDGAYWVLGEGERIPSKDYSNDNNL